MPNISLEHFVCFDLDVEFKESHLIIFITEVQ